MTKRYLEEHRDTHEIVVVFANTGCEHEATLEFVRDCDRYFGFGTIWIESVITQGARIGPRPRVVTFETASRNGEPFEAYIAKHGIPNVKSPQCTTRLKTDPMEYYIRKVHGWKKGSYVTAIGIRADETDRVSTNKDKHGFIYPLCEAGITKEDVRRECASWPFQLNLSGEHYGNCKWCWKKSFRKLMTLSVESPDVFDFPRRMETQYGHVQAKNENGVRNFFRGDRSVDDIFEMAKQPFEKYADKPLPFDESLDVGSGCGESCEIGADE